MKKIIPFKKEILFNNNVSEITSISLEHTLKVKNDNLISGNFIISGEYKMADNSTNTEPFDFELPCDINLDDRYDIGNIQIDIDDFYYEVINSNILQVNIDVLIDHLEEHEILETEELEINKEEFNYPEEEQLRKENIMDNILDDVVQEQIDDKEVRCIEEEDTPMSSIFSTFNKDDEIYRTYKVYIVREGDSVESIIQKYQINRDDLEQYNDLTEINLGDKLIIPALYNEKD